MIKPFNPEALAYPWSHADSRVDELQSKVASLVEDLTSLDSPRREVFSKVRALACEYTGRPAPDAGNQTNPLVSKPIPYLTENWYC
jgi:hypothetical protein